MNIDLTFLQLETDRIGARIEQLEKRSKNHAETQAHLARKIGQLEEKLADDSADPELTQKLLAHLRIEAEQLVEAERQVKHHLKELNNQFGEFANALEMQRVSSMV